MFTGPIELVFNFAFEPGGAFEQIVRESKASSDRDVLSP